jgi:hypothetical protein
VTVGSGLGQVYDRHRYAVLFCTLILTLALAPLMTALRFSADLLQIFLAFNLLIALLGVPGRRWRLIVLLIAAVAVGVRVAPASTVRAELASGALVVTTLLAALTVVTAVRFALRATVIDTEHVCAALSAYLLAGLIFGILHWEIATTWPGAFSDASAGDPQGGFPLSTAIYFSFVTLATLGYGDVLPRSEAARGLAIFEAVAGQLYIAVTIARLVGAQLQTPRQGVTK